MNEKEAARSEKEISTRTIPQVDQGVWKENEWMNTNKEDIGLCNRFREKIHTKKKKSLSLV